MKGDCTNNFTREIWALLRVDLYNNSATCMCLIPSCFFDYPHHNQLFKKSLSESLSLCPCDSQWLILRGIGKSDFGYPHLYAMKVGWDSHIAYRDDPLAYFSGQVWLVLNSSLCSVIKIRNCMAV